MKTILKDRTEQGIHETETFSRDDASGCSELIEDASDIQGYHIHLDLKEIQRHQKINVSGKIDMGSKTLYVDKTFNSPTALAKASRYLQRKLTYFENLDKGKK